MGISWRPEPPGRWITDGKRLPEPARKLGVMVERSESEVLDCILQTAEEDPRIRAVIMNGSRANPRAARDPFQDFDIVYFVTEVAPFFEDRQWIQRFGELMILQLPETMREPPTAVEEGFAYLMQFQDGHRIDLGIFPLSAIEAKTKDSLTVVLMDKDHVLPDLPAPSEMSYLPRPPTPKQYADCCNEFWWMSPYAAKGLWRGQIIYAHQILDGVLREQLLKMLVWLTGTRTDFKANPGYQGKHLQEYLASPEWRLLVDTYADANPDNLWRALLAMGELFRIAANAVGDTLGLEYPGGDDERVTSYLHHVRAMPREPSART
jgi:aminoglycoside 6-adenylyltransferase